MAVGTVVIATAIPLAAPATDSVDEAEPGAEQHRQKQQPFHDPTQTTSCSMLPYILLGIVTGFSIQLVSLGAYALLLIHDNSNATIATATSDEEVTAAAFPGVAASTSSPFSLSFSIVTFVVESLTTPEGAVDALAPPSRPQMWTTTHNTHNSVLHTLLCLFSQLDIVVYVMIWIAFTWTMTKQGMIRCCRRRGSTTTTTNTASSSSSSSSTSNNNQDRRSIFRRGVYFLGGIVIGAFIAWSMIDLYLQFPIPLTPIVLTVLLDLLLCYGMLVCYDLGNNSTTTPTTSTTTTTPTWARKTTQLYFHDDGDGDGETYEEERG